MSLTLPLTDLLSLGSREALASLLRERAEIAWDEIRSSIEILGNPDEWPIPPGAGQHNSEAKAELQSRWSESEDGREELETLERRVPELLFSLYALQELEAEALRDSEVVA